jgi:hypothetical protein
MKTTDGVTPLADSILYLLSLLRAGSRPIDRYIDYFGECGTAVPARVFSDGSLGARRYRRSHPELGEARRAG